VRGGARGRGNDPLVPGVVERERGRRGAGDLGDQLIGRIIRPVGEAAHVHLGEVLAEAVARQVKRPGVLSRNYGSPELLVIRGSRNLEPPGCVVTRRCVLKLCFPTHSSSSSTTWHQMPS